MSSVNDIRSHFLGFFENNGHTPVASGPLVPRYFLALLAILAIPLARVSAAPLALAWNRHR